MTASQHTVGEGMTITLDQLDTFFNGLSEENQLRLLDHLADRTNYADELAKGHIEAVKAYAFATASDEFEADHITDRLAWVGSSPKGWRRHCEERDRHLKHAIEWRSARRAA